MNKEKPCDGEPEVLVVVSSNRYGILNIKTIQRGHQQYPLKVAKHLLSHEVIEGGAFVKMMEYTRKGKGIACRKQKMPLWRKVKGSAWDDGKWRSRWELDSNQLRVEEISELQDRCPQGHEIDIISDVFHQRRLRKFRETLKVNKG